MKFLILSREDVESPSFNPGEPYILISITDPYNGQEQDKCGVAKLNSLENMLDVLRLEFFDIEEPIGNLEMMSNEQANAIANFVNTWLGKTNLIVVHCEFGRSRSPSVVAALSRWINGDDARFFDMHFPNMHVYDRVLKALRCELS
jgi:predicted protein tyrosine phosphatase